MPGRTAAGDDLHCPACGTSYDEPERFCPDCKLPLVRAEGVIEGSVSATSAPGRSSRSSPRAGWCG